MHTKTIASLPTLVPGSNTYKAVVFQQPLPGSDFERLEDMSADAIALARKAVSSIRALPHQLFKPLQSHVDLFEKQVDMRRILNDNFRVRAEDILDLLARTHAPDDETEDRIDQIRRELRDALETSYRVSDLLGAEKDVGWHRGIGRD